MKYTNASNPSRKLHSFSILLTCTATCSVAAVAFHGDALAHIKCPVRTIFRTTEDLCPHIHMPEPTPAISGPYTPQPSNGSSTDPDKEWRTWWRFYMGKQPGAEVQGWSRTIEACNKGREFNSQVRKSYLNIVLTPEGVTDPVMKASGSALRHVMREVCPSVW